MSIRDILHDRQSRRMKENGLQKDGYRYMLSFMANRRRQNPHIDISKEEVKLMNAVKMLVESGWVVDQNYFKHLIEVSGISKVWHAYCEAKLEKRRVDGQTIALLRFANKFAENLGLPNFFGRDILIQMPRDNCEVFFTLDLGLYSDVKAKPTMRTLSHDSNINAGNS